jgi:hypothetical protein
VKQTVAIYKLLIIVLFVEFLIKKGRNENFEIHADENRGILSGTNWN